MDYIKVGGIYLYEGRDKVKVVSVLPVKDVVNSGFLDTEEEVKGQLSFIWLNYKSNKMLEVNSLSLSKV